MKNKHLIWIIPLTLLLGLMIGTKLGLYSVDKLVNLVDDMDKCSMPALTYAIENDQNCEILLTGFMKTCTEDLEELRNLNEQDEK